MRPRALEPAASRVVEVHKGQDKTCRDGGTSRRVIVFLRGAPANVHSGCALVAAMPTTRERIPIDAPSAETGETRTPMSILPSVAGEAGTTGRHGKAFAPLRAGRRKLTLDRGRPSVAFVSSVTAVTNCIAGMGALKGLLLYCTRSLLYR